MAIKIHKIPHDIAFWIKKHKQLPIPSEEYSEEDALNDSVHYVIHGLYANYPESNTDVRDRVPVLKWLEEDRGNYYKLVDAVRHGYQSYIPRWEVKVGDLVVKKGKHEAKVHFVESLDINDDGQITSILLVDGRADMFFDSDCIDDFFNEYRLLVKKENLEEEI